MTCCAIEMFKFYNGLSPPMMNHVFKLKTEKKSKTWKTNYCPCTGLHKV